MTQRHINIVLVEDDEDDHHLIVDMLSEIEDGTHVVTWARSFEAGIECLSRDAADVYLVDFRIGARSGVEFMQEVKRLGDLTPVVFLTGMADRQIDLAAMEAGAYDFLRKSELTAAMLDRAIRYAISLAESRRILLERTVLLQATLDNTDAGICAVDRSGVLVTWNDRFAELLVQLYASSEGGSSPFDGEENLTGFNLSCKAPLLASTREELDAGDGRILAIHRNEIVDGGAVIVCRDITQHKLAEQALRSAIVQAEAASASKSAFLANVSHELRTPLNAIIGFAELMIGQTHGPLTCSEYEEYVSVIKQSGDALLGIINATLDLSRIEAKEYKLDPVGVTIADLIRTALGPLRQEADSKSLGFKISLQNDDMTVVCDENALNKVMGQLLSNAIKFSNNGDVISISAHEIDGAVHLEVADQGIGMDPEEIRRAQSSFSQADQQLARNYEGIGLGLALVGGLIELLGGRLTISSTPDAGTTVTAILPKSRDLLDELGDDIVSETVALSA